MSALDELPILTRCCLCVPLETGAVLVSLLSLLLPDLVLCAKIIILSTDVPYIPYEWRIELKITFMDMVGAVIGPFVAVLLLMGVIKKSHSYILSYLFITIFIMIVCALEIFLDSFAHPKVNLVKLIFLVFFGYLWLCVQSLYQKFKHMDPDYRYLLA